MPATFWIEEYRKKAALPDPVAQSGRGNTFQAVQFLHVVQHVLELLDLRRHHDLLDIGCANGLIDIPLSACVRSILALEPVEELAQKARDNLKPCRRARVAVGHGGDIPAEDRCFDRILMMGVLQLVHPRDVPAMFAECNRVLRPGGRMLIGSIPDGRCRAAFLDPYLEGVRRAAHLSDEQKAAIFERNLQAHWYHPNELTGYWQALGAHVTVAALGDGDPDRDHRYHLLVSLPE
jgi:cyclopropane fatty-acyl-phospholipid synthase-like methyltransferase